MTLYGKTHERYHNDAKFASVVDALTRLIDELEMTPSEVRECAMFACILHEMRHPSPIVLDGIAYEFVAREKGGR